MIQDLRHAVRMLLMTPGFTLVIVLILALGIGANTALFSVTDAILLKGLPVKAPEQLVLLSYTSSSPYINLFSYRTYEQFRDHDQTLSGVFAYYPTRITVSVDDQTEPAVSGQLVSGSYYQVLGVNAVLGRMIEPDDDRDSGPAVCVISHAFWQKRFGGDRGIVGKTIRIGGSPFTIIGVTPPEFFGTEVGSSMDVSAPIVKQQQVMPGSRSFIDEQWERFHVMGRLRPGVTSQQAQVSLGRIYQQDIADFAASISGDPKGNAEGQELLKQRLVVTSGGQGLAELRRQFSKPLFILMCLVGLVLLVTCANATGLFLARGVARRKEMAVRLALGAGRLRLVRQLLTESVMLAGLGGLLGLLLSWWSTRLLLPLLSQRDLPLSLSLNPDIRVLGFTASVALLTSILFGLAPAIVATRADLQSTLKQDSQAIISAAKLRFGRAFVAVQVALSLLLLIGAGLFVRSLQKLHQVETGYAPEKVLVLKLEPIHSDNKDAYRRQLSAFYDELLRRVKATPGVEHASLVGYSPISRREWLVIGESPDQESLRRFYVEGRAEPEPEETVNWMQVYPESFAALGIPLVAGRDFGSQDKKGAPEVAVINESMARVFFGNENPIGKRFGGINWVRWNPIEIVGVVKDAKYISLRQENLPMFYVPFAQSDTSMAQMTLVVRTTSDTATIAEVMQREARALDPAMPRFEVETVASQLDASLTQERLVAALSSVFGLLALLLVCIGIYSLMAYEVARRTREIGIRMAVGARASDVLRVFVRQGMTCAVIGVLFGLALAVALTRLLSSFLFGVTALDSATFAGVTLMLILLALLACLIPARRATKVDPLVALRYE